MQQLMSGNMRLNPYEKIYRNLNIQITNNLTREGAEEIARHLAFLHNTFGTVAKDMIKILSYKFLPQGPQPKKTKITSGNGKDGISLDQNQRWQKNDSDRMDIQNSYRDPVQPNLNRPAIFFNKKRKNPQVVQICEDDEKSITNQQNISNAAIEPPNCQLFDEFAYEKAVQEQPKIRVLDKKQSILKEHLAKIIAKKKEQKNNLITAITQNQASLMVSSLNENSLNLNRPAIITGSFAFNNSLNNILNQSPPNHQNIQSDELNKQDLFLQEFKYNNAQKMKALQILVQPQIKQNQSQKCNKLWHLMRQKAVPEVFQISDDD